MKVLFVASEIVPYAASGGLADVAEALPIALNNQGIETTRIMPKYSGIEAGYELKKENSFVVESGGIAREATIFKHELDGVITYFIGNDYYFSRDTLYGYADDDERFGFFCKAVLQMLLIKEIKPDIIQINDWQSALIALFIKEEYAHLSFYKDMKVIFTIHNLQYQGVFGTDVLEDLNLSNKYFNTELIEYYGKVCYMKAGIVDADLVTTVSKTYAKEIQTPQYGYGLDGLLCKYSNKICGIVNGIYYDKYDPNKDKALSYNFNANNFRKIRPKQKEDFQKELGLPVKDVPLIGVVSRLAEQKGISLILELIKSYVKEDVQFVVLGTGSKEYEEKLKKLGKKYPDKVSANIMFNQGFSKRVYASCDMFLMPSLFEPCGLSQLYSLRFGAVPIVRATGGLVDTIVDYNEDPKNGTGFKFKNFNYEDFKEALNRSIELYKHKKDWETLVERCLNTRFSWDDSAKEYISKFKEVLNKA